MTYLLRRRVGGDTQPRLKPHPTPIDQAFPIFLARTLKTWEGLDIVISSRVQTWKQDMAATNQADYEEGQMVVSIIIAKSTILQETRAGN